jgi:hypothetical protein
VDIQQAYAESVRDVVALGCSGCSGTCPMRALGGPRDLEFTKSGQPFGIAFRAMTLATRIVLIRTDSYIISELICNEKFIIDHTRIFFRIALETAMDYQYHFF